MAMQKLLARDAYKEVEINTGTESTPSWTHIGGINNISPSSSRTNTDDADWDDNGWARHKVAQRSRSLTIEGFYKEDPATGGRDAGQVALIDAGDLVGYDSTSMFRVTTIGGNMLEFDASVNMSWGSGGVNDNASFSAELQVDGKPAFTAAS